MTRVCYSVSPNKLLDETQPKTKLEINNRLCN